MQDSSTFDEIDLEIIGALQVNPRIGWDALAQVLGSSAATVSRRWAALHDARLAWVTPAPGPRYLAAGWSAFLQIAATPNAHEALLEQLCEEPAFATVSLVSGRYDILVDCFASSPAELTDVVTASFARLPGVIRRDVLFTAEVYRQATEWRSGVLEPSETRSLTTPPHTASPGFSPDRVDRAMLAALTHDGRASLATLAQECGISPQTVRRRLDRILDAGYVALRCDASSDASPGFREVTLLLNVPADDIATVGRYFADLTACRVSAHVIGAENLLVTLWVRNYLEVRDHERVLARLAPGSTVVGRQAVMRTYKRLGHVLDARGRRTRYIALPLG
ncbi:Lrp/AsnC family transcriptional regulator [Nocardia sp. NEAU-G5]|uniref:Lrp/AsnC family transcriptional regulator n=1 Tax=Nocardia albiluteola TaxID=2842303 RepID=A0ABS6AVP1_9NOCA|nr:Lrp/AsnC family transcriptional regulator [Nocardia albiluteola]MBU3061958.1 Lrp/AsnC family transcriptional regulator [Nocardia albiluteola]